LNPNGIKNTKCLFFVVFSLVFNIVPSVFVGEKAAGMVMGISGRYNSSLLWCIALNIGLFWAAMGVVVSHNSHKKTERIRVMPKCIFLAFYQA